MIAHLADGEVILGSRVRFVAAQDRPPLLGYDQDAFVERLGIEKAKTAELLDAFAAAREGSNVAFSLACPRRLVCHASALHAERGEESIRYDGPRCTPATTRIHEQQILEIRTGLLAKKSSRKQLREKRKARKAAKQRSSDGWSHASARYVDPRSPRRRSQGAAKTCPHPGALRGKPTETQVAASWREVVRRSRRSRLGAGTGSDGAGPAAAIPGPVSTR